MSLYPIVPNAMVPSIARIDILRLLLDLMAYCLRSNAYGASAGHNLPRHVIAMVLRESREAGSLGSRGCPGNGCGAWRKSASTIGVQERGLGSGTGIKKG